MQPDRMTGSERMRALVMKLPMDRVPVVPMVSGYTAVLSGYSMEEYFLNPETAMKAQEWAADLHGYDGTPGFGIPHWGGWDFGGELKFPVHPKAALPILAKRAVEKIDEVERLVMPNPLEAPGASRMLAFARMAHSKGYPVSVYTGSPMGVAGSIVNTDLLFRWFHKEPQKVHQVLRLATDYLKKIGDLIVDEVGAEACSAFSTYPVECHGLMSPRVFGEFSVPYIQEVHCHFMKRGIKKWLVHLCGDHRKNLSFWKNELALPPRSIFSIGHEMDLADTGRELGEDYIIGGNIPTELLYSGKPAEIIQTCQRILEKMKHHSGGFVLMPACGMPPTAPPVNVHAMVKAVRIYGKMD